MSIQTHSEAARPRLRSARRGAGDPDQLRKKRAVMPGEVSDPMRNDQWELPPKPDKKHRLQTR